MYKGIKKPIMTKVTIKSRTGLALNRKGGTEYKTEPIIPIKKTIQVAMNFAPVNVGRSRKRFKGSKNIQRRPTQVNIVCLLRELPLTNGFRRESRLGLSLSLSLSKYPFKLKCPNPNTKREIEPCKRESGGNWYSRATIRAT